MNAFQRCPNTTDAVPFYLPQQLYLKPIARINVSIQLSQQKIMGKTITNWELMERLREIVQPDEFTVLKVTKTTIEVIRFEAEVEHKNVLTRVISKLDNKLIKLKDFPDLLRVRAANAKLNYPLRHEWDSYFRDAKNMDEMKPGERPDTVHISNLPSKWFVPYHISEDKDNLPSEKLFFRIFEKYGSIRKLDIPICDPYRHKMKSHITGIQTSSFDEKDFFEGYVQFKDYVGFSKCMDSLRGMKLLCKEDSENVTVNIYVDFDKTKHLSEASIRRREIVRDRMVLKEQSKEELKKEAEEKQLQNEKDLRDKELNKKSDKDKRRRIREEKRKAKILSQLKNNPTDDISDKIAKEEKKLVQVQRKLEAIRLVEELFQRIKAKNDRDSSPINKRKKGDEDELAKMKHHSELEVKNQREKLHQAIGGRVVLKSILSSHSSRRRNQSSSSEQESPPHLPNPETVSRSPIVYPPMFDPNWYNYQPNNNASNMYYHPTHFLNPNPPPIRGYFGFPPRGRGLRALPAPGPSRGMLFQPRNNFNHNYRGRGRGGQNHFLQQDFFKYAQKFLEEQIESDHLQYDRAAKSRSRSRSYSRHRSHSRSRSRRRSYSRSRRSYSRSKSRSRSRTRRSLSRNRSVSRSRRSGSRSNRSQSRWTPDSKHKRRSVSSRRSRSDRRGRSRSASQNHRRSRSQDKDRNNHERQSRSKSANGERRVANVESVKGRSRTKSRESLKSVDSSQFISPNRLRKSRSKS